MKVLSFHPKLLVLWLLRSLTIFVGLVIFPSMVALAADPLAGRYSEWQAVSPSSKVFSDVLTPTGKVTLTGAIKSSPTGNSRPLRVNTTTNPSQLSDSYFLFGQEVDNRDVTNEIKFTSNLPIDKVSIALFGITSNFRYRDKLIIYGLDSTSATPNNKIYPVLNNKYDSTNPANNNIASSLSPDGLIIYSLSEDFENSDGNIRNNDVSQGITFNKAVDTIVIKYGNAEITQYNTKPIYQVVGLAFDNFEVFMPPLIALTKDDGVAKVNANSTTSYSIVVKNKVTTAVSGVTLSDPIATGLTKQASITCDTSVANNICSTATLPSLTQLEAGYALPTIPVGYNYAIKVPTLVNQTSGYVTNTATATYSGLTTPIVAQDIDEVVSPFDSGFIASPGTCPVGHQRFMINNVGTTAPTLASWVAGSTSRIFNFSTTNGPIKFTISFTDVLDTRNNSPYYGRDNNGISDSLYMTHQSTKNITNHMLNLTIDKPVSQAGFIIQDLDAEESNLGTSYQEQVDVSATNGKLTYVPGVHTINSQNNIVTAIKGQSCNSTRPCSINADWGYKPANTTMTLAHKNLAGRDSTSKHELGYSSFYYCLAPPKLIVKKVLTGKRVESDDEFKFEVKDGASTVGSFITESVNGVFTQGKDRSQVISLTPNQAHTISESIVDSSKTVKAGAIDNYKTSYTCTNTVNNTVISNGNNNSFTLPALNFGDEVICTVTNTPSIYTFSGIVFNDNGGIDVDSTPNETQATSTVRNLQYFNGVYDSNLETGISHPNLSVKLKNGCAADATDIANQTLYIARADGVLTSTTDANDTIVDAAIKKGQYKIVVPAASLKNKTSVCLKEIEPASWASDTYGDNIYPIDTTKNEIAIDLTATPTKLDYTDNNFGEVRQNNAALILQKRQYIAECTAIKKLDQGLLNSKINTQDVTNTGDDTVYPREGFSKNDPKNTDNEGNSIIVAPGLCIAYKITAINRGHVELTDVKISDALQTIPVISYYLSEPATITPDNLGLESAPSSEANGIIRTKGFVLPPASEMGPTAKSLYFNTRYGSR